MIRTTRQKCERKYVLSVNYRPNELCEHVLPYQENTNLLNAKEFRTN